MSGPVWFSISYVSSVLSILSFVITQDPVVNIPQGRVVGNNTPWFYLTPHECVYLVHLSPYVDWTKHWSYGRLIDTRGAASGPQPEYCSGSLQQSTYSIKAYTENSLNPVEIYYGVPYATAPTGRYRFSAPERHAGWKKTFYAHRIPPHCPNLGIDANGHFSEDCLYLNIWTPRRSDGKTLPVVVIFYSETWTKGGINLPCQELAAEGVVVVTVTYRLHILAFFTLASRSARGNLALLDQYLALLWVRDNIAAFGGDPTAITVLGHSAGADSVLHHITSTRSIGLFQRAIIMSPIDIWKAFDVKRVLKVADVEQASREIARLLGCTSGIEQEILKCMRDRPLTAIMSLYSNDTWNKVMQPISDKFLAESEQYLPNSLFVALSATTRLKKQLDILLGSNDLEALNYSEEEYYALLKGGKQYLSEYVDKHVIPENLKLFGLDQTELFPLLIHAVRWEYLNRKPIKDIQLSDEIEYLGRIETSAKWSTGIALTAARLASIVERLYVYRYSQPSGVDLRGKKYNFTGAVHGTDLVALLGDALMLQVARRPASLVEKQSTAIWRRHIINFIKLGSPDDNGLWKMYKTGGTNIIYELCDKKTIDAKCADSSRVVEFWLQYLPQMFQFINSNGKTDSLVGEPGELRLRGGLIAMCGTTIILLLLLIICIVLLHRYSSRRFNVTDENRY